MKRKFRILLPAGLVDLLLPWTHSGFRVHDAGVGPVHDRAPEWDR